MLLRLRAARVPSLLPSSVLRLGARAARAEHADGGSRTASGRGGSRPSVASHYAGAPNGSQDYREELFQKWTLPWYPDAVTPARGRRLSDERTDDILEVVLELLKEVGYDQLRMQDVADRAGAGLATIYRRWPTKQDLVRASLECERAQEKFAVTDEPRADVKAFLTRM